MDKYQMQFENECYVLSCLIKEPSLLTETKLIPNHFFSYHNKAIFTKMLQLKENGESIDLIGLQQSNSNDLFQMGGKEHLKDVYTLNTYVKNFKHYEGLVSQFNAVELSFQIIEDYKNQTNEVHRVSYLRELMDKLQQIDIDTSTKEKSTYEKVRDRVFQHENSPKSGLSGTNTGFLNVNKATDGWQKTDLIILGARPSMGKTALSLNMMWQASQKDEKVHGTFFTAEMGEDPIIDRIIALQAGLPVNKLRNPNKYFTPDDWEKYTKALPFVEGIKRPWSLFRDKNVADIRSKVRRLVTDYPDKDHVIYIDHLSHLKINGNYQNRTLEIGAICQELKDMAVEYKVPVVLLSQLSRGVESQQDKRPSLKDLRDSGEIEQIADVVAFIYREDYYHKNDTNYEPTGITELIIDKNRQGDLGTVYLKFQSANNRFVDVI
jgi:replicative DNA helicase